MHRPMLGFAIATAIGFITAPVGIALIFGAIGYAAAGARRGRQ